MISLNGASRSTSRWSMNSSKVNEPTSETVRSVTDGRRSRHTTAWPWLLLIVR